MAVRLRFAATLADEIAERRHHPSQVLHRLPSGEVALELHVAEPASLIRWIMGFGAEVVVEEPIQLADEIRMHHQRAAGRLPVMKRSEHEERPKAYARRII